MLKIDYKMDGDLPVEITAVDENGKVYAVVDPVVPGHTNWMLSAVIDSKPTGRQFEHSGPAIEAFTRYVAGTNEYLRQEEVVRKAETLLATEKAKLEALRNAVHNSLHSD